MKSFLSKYGYTITLHETSDDNDEHVCFACRDLVIGGPTYILERDYDARYYLHKSCAELPGKIQHPLHPQHPLTLDPRHHLYGFICDGCRHVSLGYKYRCKECKFKLDLQCVSKNEGHPLKKRVETDTIYHPHKLQLVYFHSSIPTRLSKDIVCCCCLKSCLDVRDPTYACSVCTEIPFFIHKTCLDRVPRQVRSSLHPEHPLFIQRVHCEFYCVLCDDVIREFALTCDKCHIMFHVSCGSRTTPGLRLNLQEHDMHYVIIESFDLKSCTICKADCRGAFYRCIKCDVNVHTECIPLSKIVEHESHDHPLKLTDSVVTHRDSDEYHCDICEKEGNIKHYSYYCNECKYIAHIECVHFKHEDDTSPKISCLDPRGKSKAEEETEDAEVEFDDAEKEKDFFDGQQHDKADLEDSIVNIKRRTEELALQLEADASLEKRIQNLKADLLAVIFQLEDLKKKISKFSPELCYFRLV